MHGLVLAFALAASAGPPAAGALRVALLDLEGAAAPDDRAAARALLDDALAQRGLAVVREGRPPADCGAPCLDHTAARLGVDLVLTGALSSSSGGLSLSLTLFDPRRVDAPLTRDAVHGADLNQLASALGDPLDALLRPALALRGLGPDAVKEGLGWGTPGLILGGGLVAAGSMACLGGLWPFVDRTLAAAELARLNDEGGDAAALVGAKRRIASAHSALTDWGMSAIAMGTGAALVGAAMMSAAAPE